VKKVNLYKIKLPAVSLDCVLKPNRSLALEKTINDAMSDYKQDYGDGLHIVSGYAMVGNEVMLEIWQMPKQDHKFRNFVVTAK